MNQKLEIKIGDVYNQLTVIAEKGTNARGQLLFLCRCSCGEIKTIVGYNLKNGNTKSCGCLRSEKSRMHCKEQGRTRNYTNHLFL